MKRKKKRGETLGKSERKKKRGKANTRQGGKEKRKRGRQTQDKGGRREGRTKRTLGRSRPLARRAAPAGPRRGQKSKVGARPPSGPSGNSGIFDPVGGEKGREKNRKS